MSFADEHFYRKSYVFNDVWRNVVLSIEGSDKSLLIK